MTTHVTWSGVSGQSYTFEVDPLGLAYKNRAGVYIFCKLEAGTYFALYVGETGDFNQRLNTGLQQHNAWLRVSRSGVTHVGTLHVPGTLTTRLSIETDLRQGLNPPCNLQ